MKFAKRILLFLVINFLVVTTVSFILRFLNIQPYLQGYGLNYTSLLIFCLIWGMAGAFISLGLSRIMAKSMMGVKVIDPAKASPEQLHLLQTVHRLCRDAGFHTMPQVGIYSSPEVNAFATGPSQKRSLVAVSSGLLEKLSQDELEGVLGHEVAHIANGDMVTMTLIQGVVNAFVMFLARVLAFAISGLGQQRGRSSSSSQGSYMVLVFVFEIVFMLLGSMVVAFYSRWREFRADKGGAALAGKGKMVAALQALRKTVEIHDNRSERPAFQSMKISVSRKKGFFRFFATHPPLEERIERLTREA